MKKNIIRALSAILVALTLCTMLPIGAIAAGVVAGDEDMEITLNRWQQISKETLYQDGTEVAKTLEQLTAGNDTTNKLGNKTPINNLYDQSIVGSDYLQFKTWVSSGKEQPAYGVVSKSLKLLGNHANETTSKPVFLLDSGGNKVKGKGMITVIPESQMAGLEEFTISWITRVHKPQQGSLGLVLFYDNMITEGGIDYFGGYDNYTYTGYTGTYLDTWASYTIKNGQKAAFDAEAMKTVHNPGGDKAANNSIYAKIHATKGEYTVGGKTYTAKIESYSDDQLVCTSYGYWADAPVMFYYESASTSRWSVQFTNVTLEGGVDVSTTAKTAIAEAEALDIIGTALRYDGTAGLRLFTSLKMEEVYNLASAIELGAVLLESSKYQGTLTVDTADVIVKKTAVTEENLTPHFDFEAPEITADGKYVATAYVKYTIEGKNYYYYTPVEEVNCARTATKMTIKYEGKTDLTAWETEMMAAVTPMAGTRSTYKIMGFNIMAPHMTPDTWTHRLEAVLKLYKDEVPDVIGVSEFGNFREDQSQLAMLLADEWFAANYGIHQSLGVYETGEEGMALFYNKNKLEIVSSGVKYLTGDPDSPELSQAEKDKNQYLHDCNVQYNNEHPDAPVWYSRYYTRKIVYAVFRDLQTGAQFAAVTTHLTHTVHEQLVGVYSDQLRAEQAKAVLDLINGGTCFDPNLPFTVFGDMNAKTNDLAYNQFLGDEDMIDVRYNADIQPEATQGTYHSYNNGNVFIDHMFMSKNDFYAHEYVISTKKYLSETANEEMFPSDHYAIIGTLTVLPR